MPAVVLLAPLTSAGVLIGNLRLRGQAGPAAGDANLPLFSLPRPFEFAREEATITAFHRLSSSFTAVLLQARSPQTRPLRPTPSSPRLGQAPVRNSSFRRVSTVLIADLLCLSPRFHSCAEIALFSLPFVHWLKLLHRRGVVRRLPLFQDLAKLQQGLVHKPLSLPFIDLSLPFHCLSPLIVHCMMAQVLRPA